MLNLGGIFGALGRMLPGYIEGREQAIKSNWNDLNQYNQVQAGQIRNAFGELTFPFAFNRYVDEASRSRYYTLQDLMNLRVREAGLPYELGAAWTRSEQGVPLLQQRIGATSAELNRQQENGTFEQRMQQTVDDVLNRWNPFGGSLSANTGKPVFRTEQDMRPQGAGIGSQPTTVKR